MKFKEKLLNLRDNILGTMSDVSNYFFLRKMIKEHRGDPKWQNLQLRHDWVYYRIYTVVNLRPEDFGEDEPIKIARFMDKALPIFDYMTDLNLSEIVMPIYTHIPDTYSYLLKLSLKNEYITFINVGRLLFKASVIGLIVWTILHYINFDPIYNETISVLKQMNILKQ